MSYTKTIPKDYPEYINNSPGNTLKLFLEELYPNNYDGFISAVDYDLNCEGEFLQISYHSTINYIMRRLIISAHYIYRTYLPNGEGRIKTELRRYLGDYTNFDHQHIVRMGALLLECVQNSEDDFNNTERGIAKAQVKEFDWGCYICGREMTFSDNDPQERYKLATADHKWPRFFGGESVIGNLRYACLDCNSKYKRDFLDYNDYHFQEIAFVIKSFSDYQQKAKNRSYEAAIFAKTDYCCTVCGQPAYRVGHLFIGRKDPDDSWHYFNLTAYCQNHQPEPWK